MKAGVASRAAAARCVAAVLQGATADSALSRETDKVPERDRALLRELVYGTLRAYPRLNALLSQLLSRPLKKGEMELQALALVGLYQLGELRTPDHAAVSATVDASAAIGRSKARGLLNAVLRRYLREREQLHAALPAAAAQAMPQWLWDALGQHWPAQRDSIAAACAARPPLTLRVNRQRATRDSALAQLAAASMNARSGSLNDDAITLDEARDVRAIPGFSEGHVSVQDEAAQLAATLLNPRPGERVLDACAAPGGKSCHLLELEPGLDLVACDISAERLARVQENAERLGLAPTLLCADLRAPDRTLTDAAPFDAMLLDVPCSATGVIRRHPDIKVLRRPRDTGNFAEQQLAILKGCWPLLRPGGRLLYVTCSILPAENSDLVAAFLAQHADARETPLSISDAHACAIGAQLLPTADGTDGLYFALFMKKE